MEPLEVCITASSHVAAQLSVRLPRLRHWHALETVAGQHAHLRLYLADGDDIAAFACISFFSDLVGSQASGRCIELHTTYTEWREDQCPGIRGLEPRLPDLLVEESASGYHPVFVFQRLFHFSDGFLCTPYELEVRFRSHAFEESPPDEGFDDDAIVRQAVAEAEALHRLYSRLKQPDANMRSGASEGPPADAPPMRAPCRTPVASAEPRAGEAPAPEGGLHAVGIVACEPLTGERPARVLPPRELLARKALERPGEVGASPGVQQETMLHARGAESLRSLVASGEYEEITPEAGDSLAARTSPVTIAFDGWDFALGRFDIRVGGDEVLAIRSADGVCVRGCPHPHVASDGLPCLGNIGPAVYRAIEQRRFAEALSAIRVFLGSYNPSSPYVRLDEFDPNYRLRDISRCSECLGSLSPYCVMECPRNETGAIHSCSECTEYRTNYCYDRCPENAGFVYVHPCDECAGGASPACGECPWNDDYGEATLSEAQPEEDETEIEPYQDDAAEPGTPCNTDGLLMPVDYGWPAPEDPPCATPCEEPHSLVENGGDLCGYMLLDSDEADDPCLGCVRGSTSYCLQECPHNEARSSEVEAPKFLSGQAAERSRPRAALDGVPRCEDCVEDAAYCYLRCPPNADWSRRDPCYHCRLGGDPECNAKCPFRARRLELHPWEWPDPRPTYTSVRASRNPSPQVRCCWSRLARRPG